MRTVGLNGLLPKCLFALAKTYSKTNADSIRDIREIMMRILALGRYLLLSFSIAISLFACGDRHVPFVIDITPENMEDTIAGQRCVFLAAVTDKGDCGLAEAVGMSAEAEGATVTVNPRAIAPGQVSEITVVPDETSVGETLAVTISGERNGWEQEETVTVQVREGQDLIAEAAAEMRDKFVPWLAENQSGLGITADTEWTGTIVKRNITIVSYYLFFSEDWEMGVSWHVMIPPHDWARIYLRDRGSETAPSYAFEISSCSGAEDPHTMDPPDSVWR